jgi:hypothetical protein
MDVEVARQNDEKAIQQKIDMLRRHAEVSMALIERGEAYLKEHGVQKAADAIRAIALGMERESLSRGFRIALDDMGKKSDEELVRLVEQRMGLANGVSDDAIDGESTDVTDADTKSE